MENFQSVDALHSILLIFGSLAQFAQVNNNANSTVRESFIEQPTDKVVFFRENFQSVGVLHSISMFFGSLAQFGSFRQNLATLVMPNLATNLPNRVNVFLTDL